LFAEKAQGEVSNERSKKGFFRSSNADVFSRQQLQLCEIKHYASTGQHPSAKPKQKRQLGFDAKRQF
jgi:hypothetical protein